MVQCLRQTHVSTPARMLYLCPLSNQQRMSEEKSLNFIEEIIEDDLKIGKYTSIVTRFPPEPNGYLHIGHAKSICLNFGLTKNMAVIPTFVLMIPTR